MTGVLHSRTCGVSLLRKVEESLLRKMEESKLCSAKEGASRLLGASDCDRGFHLTMRGEPVALVSGAQALLSQVWLAGSLQDVSRMQLSRFPAALHRPCLPRIER